MWAEPINTASNIAFLIAAYFAYRSFSKNNPGFKKSFDIVFLILNLFTIGIGSAIYHMFATHATMLMDVIPITIFINVYLLSFVVRILHQKIGLALLVWILFQGVNAAFVMYVPETALNGSVMYAPAYSMLLVFLGLMAVQKNAEVKAMAAAVGIFTTSLLMRTFDHALCNLTGFGTHFGWHLLNGLLLYVLLQMLIRAAAKKA